MASNTKLDKMQKQLLRNFKRDNPDVAFATCGRLTVCVEITGKNTVKFTTALASKDEKKFRRKVGEAYAVSRMQMGQGQPVPGMEFCRGTADAQTVADDLSQRLW